jgi:predicted  nucleic acid-binding Zn-ribbon protein
MPKVNADEYTEKLTRRLKGALDDVRKGVEKVDVAPTAQAAAKKAKMLARLTDAINSGKWENGLKAVSLEDWKAKMTSKGVNRISEGLDAAQDKIKKVAGQLLDYEGTLQGTVSKMPDLTIEDSVNRAGAWIRGMSKFKKGS